ncbi:MAG: FlgD immunoglobulin-like domain containing protein [bacterium]|nr:FlgD immunoglobulin-like domain containing protein [bacterium]
MKKQYFLGLFLLSFVAIISPQVYATGYNTVYVDSAVGSDSFDGSVSIHQGGVVGPKATIQAGINTTNSGGICFVSKGTYHENIVLKPEVQLVGAGADFSIISSHGTIIKGGSNTPGAGNTIVTGFRIIKDDTSTSTFGYFDSLYVTFVRNVFIGHYAAIHCMENGHPTVINNTIINNVAHGIIFGINAEPIIKNNIISSNTNGISFYSGATPLADIGFNDFWNNGMNYNGYGFQDTIGAKGNISQNPLFVDTTVKNFHLKPGSACIDAGDSSLGNKDPDGTRIDIGAFFFNQDTTAPSAPESLTANGKNPSPWTQNPVFEICYKKNNDPSGIKSVLYKLGSAPTSKFDTTGLFYGEPPMYVSLQQEGAVPLYVWLGDGVGNINFNNYSIVYLRRDTTAPTNCNIYALPDTITTPNFIVRWSKGVDSMSGLSNSYYVKVRDGNSNWNVWLGNYPDTFAIFNGLNKHLYHFLVYTFDSAENIGPESFPGCSTFLNIFTGDTTAPTKPESLEVVTGDGETYIYWKKVITTDLKGYNVYSKTNGDSIFTRINSHIITGKWFHDKSLFNGTKYWYVVTSVDASGNESNFSDSIAAIPADTFPPRRVSEFRASLLSNNGVKLSWVKSSSYDCEKYNIYSDNATGTINYTTPIATVLHPDTIWVHSLTMDTTYIFGLRAEDISGHEEKNENVVVTVGTITDTNKVKVRILAPYSGKRISGNRVTIFAGTLFWKPQWWREIKCVQFEYKSIDSVNWKLVQSAYSLFTNPDSSWPYFALWNISDLSEGNYQLRAVATDTSDISDAKPSGIIITIDNKYPDEQEFWGTTKIAAHSKRETVERMCNNVMILGSESENNITRIAIPELALEENTSLVCVIKDPSESPSPNPYLSTDAFRQIWLENGQQLLLGGLKSDISIPYVDSNFSFPETSLWMGRYNGVSWDPIEYTIDTVSNIVYGKSNALGTFFALLGPMTGTEEPDSKIAINEYKLFPSTPNPFSYGSIISYQIPVETKISLKIYDVTGKLIKTLVDGTCKPGYYKVQWDAKNTKGESVSTGIYFYKLATANFTDVKKMVIVK